MLTLLVYLFRGNHYVILLGGSQNFQTREEVFLSGEEEEVFTITHEPNKPFLQTVRELVAELDQRGIKDLLAMEVLFSAGSSEIRNKEAKSVN